MVEQRGQFGGNPDGIFQRTCRSVVLKCGLLKSLDYRTISFGGHGICPEVEREAVGLQKALWLEKGLSVPLLFSFQRRGAVSCF